MYACTYMRVSIGKWLGANMEIQARLLPGGRIWAVICLLYNHMCPPVFNRYITSLTEEMYV